MHQPYTLKDFQQQSSLSVVPARGGIITHWQVRGQDILYLDAERFADSSLSVRGGIPILFPICGNLPGDTYTYGGQDYPLKQHGFARNLPWQVDAQMENSLSLSLDSTPTTLAQYPFEFRLEFTYRLEPAALEIQQRVINPGTNSLPFSLGLHPYFQVDDKTQLQFQIPAEQMWNQVAQASQVYSGSFNWEASELDLAFRPVLAQEAMVHDQSRGLTLRLKFSAPYTTLVFWTLKDQDFYCLEPWSAPRNALNTGEDITTLAPGTSLTTTLRLEVELLER